MKSSRVENRTDRSAEDFLRAVPDFLISLFIPFPGGMNWTSRALAILLLAAACAPRSHAIVIAGSKGVQASGILADGEGDQYDQFGFLTIDGVPFASPLTGAAPAFSFAAQTIAGIAVAAQVSGLDALGVFNASTDYRFVRWWYTLRNTGSAARTVEVVFSGELGSDAATTTAATSSGDAAFTARDLWVVSDDGSQTDGDPAQGLLIGSIGAPLPPAVASLSADRLAAGFHIPLLPGKTLALVFFAVSRNVGGSGVSGKGTPADAIADLNTLTGGSGVVLSQFLAGGLTAPSSIANLTAANPGPRIKISKVTQKNGRTTIDGAASDADGIAEIRVRVGKLSGRVKGAGKFHAVIKAPGAIKIEATDGLGVTTTKKVKPPR
jgi:hypothetical protein